tara:strand:+ start:591 stop:1421 length:831 start_codon:yes stop_codon:yes gene_type:complete
MKCLVTGHKGFIGQKIFRELVALGHNVTGLDLKEGADILDTLPDENFDYVFHLAARVGVSCERPSFALKQNVLATSRLLEWSKKNGVKRFIFSSSSSVTGNGAGPMSPYALHKLMSEQECALYSRLYGLETVCLRYFNVFSEEQTFGGSHSSIICCWKEMIKTGRPLKIYGNGEQTRDFIHIDDICRANLFFMKFGREMKGDVFDIGSGASISINDLKNIVVKQHPNVIWQYEEPNPGDPMHTKASTEEAKKLGWISKTDPRLHIEKAFMMENGII